MKNFCVVLSAILILFVFTSCSSDTHSSLRDGAYYMTGDNAEGMTPYFDLSLEDCKFQLGAGALFSYAEYGTFEIDHNRIIAKSQSTTFIFEIINQNKLILTDNGGNDFFKLPFSSEFIYSEKLK